MSAANAANPGTSGNSGNTGNTGNTAEITLPSTDSLREIARTALQRCGADVDAWPGGGGSFRARTQITGKDVFPVPAAGPAAVEAAFYAAHETFLSWRTAPAPVGGETVKRFGQLLTEHKGDIADLIGAQGVKIGPE